MPKMKTNRATAKRLRFTASGKIKRGKAFKSHLLTKKSTGRKRALRQGGYVHTADEKKMKRLMPYS